MANQKELAKITSRAAVDADFRKLLLSDPHKAITEASGMTPPSHLRIKFVEKGADLDALVVLPDFLPEASKLTPQELEAVAGGQRVEAGADGDCWWSCACTQGCTLSFTAQA